MFLTLQSGINVGPTFINFGFFSKPYSLIKGPTLIKFWKKSEKKYKFWLQTILFRIKIGQLFQALRLFRKLWLLFLSNFPGSMFIPFPTFIPDSRVIYLDWLNLVPFSTEAFLVSDILGTPPQSLLNQLQFMMDAKVHGYSRWYSVTRVITLQESISLFSFITLCSNFRVRNFPF